MNVQEVDWSFKFCEKNLAKYTENYKSRRMRLAGHATRIGRRGLHTRFRRVSQKEGEH
jgi:hypothetical protein